MSRRTIYLHAGFHKTATSSIQATCRGARDDLLRQGILYPLCLGQDHSRFIDCAFRRTPAVYRVDLNAPISEAAQRRQGREQLDALCREAANTEFSHLLISGESMSTLDNQEVAELKRFLLERFPGFDHKVILCTREYDAFQSSALQQRIKGGEKTPIRFPCDMYRRRMEKFIEHFGMENLDVYTFEEACAHPSGPVGFFLDRIGVDRTAIELKRINEGLSDRAVDLMAYINCRIPAMVRRKKSPFRQPNDLVPLHAVRGGKFRGRGERTEEEERSIREDTLWLRDTFGIDYACATCRPVNPPVAFDEQFADDVIRCFPKVPRNIRVCICRYLRDKADERSGEERKALSRALESVCRLEPGIDTCELERCTNKAPKKPKPGVLQSLAGRVRNLFRVV